MKTEINFFKEGVSFRMSKVEGLKKWITSSAKKEGKTIEALNYIFCSDKYLRKMNKEYLEHDYNTDIITFDNSEEKGKVIGDIFISIDRVKSNSAEYETTFLDELHRVMIHGLLHLAGYDDTDAAKKMRMRKKEDEYLLKRKF